MGELLESPQVHEAQTVTYDGAQTLSGILLCLSKAAMGWGYS